MFLSPDDSILWKLTELHIMVAQEGMPEDNKSNISAFNRKHGASVNTKAE